MERQPHNITENDLLALLNAAGLTAHERLGELSEAEAALLASWVQERSAHGEWKTRQADTQQFSNLLFTYRSLKDAEAGAWEQFRRAHLQQPAPTNVTAHRVRFLKTAWFRWAAILILISGVGIYTFFNTSRPNKKMVQTTPTSVTQDIMPGSDKAILTLSNGQQIPVNKAGFEIIHDGTLSIENKNGQLSYKNADVMAVNTMTTPKGGQYQLTLADGTRVWLNAASSITFPTAFMGNTREVTITGEAYFDVAHNEAKPFIVKNETKNVEVQVLGTQFNVNTYADENAVKVTLLKGSVKILRPAQHDKAVVIKPGQQAVVTDKMNVANDIDLEEVMAWKNGKFQFGDQMDVQSIMRQIARWYDVEIEYKGNVNGFVGGSISRNVNISNVIKMLEKTGEVKFKIEGKKIIVTK
jgi:transmembrane sensor